MSNFESRVQDLNEDLDVKTGDVEKEPLLSHEEFSELNDLFKEKRHLGEGEAADAPANMLRLQIEKTVKKFGKKCENYQLYYLLVSQPVDVSKVEKVDFPGEYSVAEFIKNL
jgi:hypothetical protein